MNLVFALNWPSGFTACLAKNGLSQTPVGSSGHVIRSSLKVGSHKMFSCEPVSKSIGNLTPLISIVLYGESVVCIVLTE